MLRYGVGVMDNDQEELVSLSCGDVRAYLSPNSYLCKKFTPACHL